MSEAVNDIALIGLAVMGQNLVLNMNDHGYKVAVYNRTTSVTDEFIEGPAKGTDVVGFDDVAALVKSLKKPRRIVILVKAGGAVDAVINQLLPLVDEGDVIVDLGNSHYPDSQRRFEELSAKGIRFVGSGVSGEEGARRGPSIMPGGDESAWEFIKPDISAKSEGEPCCDQRCRWCWSLREDGSQRYRIWRHAAHLQAYQLMHEGLGLNTTKCTKYSPSGTKVN